MLLNFGVRYLTTLLIAEFTQCR